MLNHIDHWSACHMHYSLCCPLCESHTYVITATHLLKLLHLMFYSTTPNWTSQESFLEIGKLTLTHLTLLVQVSKFTFHWVQCNTQLSEFDTCRPYSNSIDATQNYWQNCWLALQWFPTTKKIATLVYINVQLLSSECYTIAIFFSSARMILIRYWSV